MQKFLTSSFLVIGLLFLILILHVLALLLGWYLTVPNFDNVHHFLGGFWVAALFLWFVRARGGLFDWRRSFLMTSFFILATAALFGVLWEFFEFSVDRALADQGVIPKAQAGLTDTMGDLFFDLLGAAVFVMLYKRFVPLQGETGGRASRS